MQINDATNTLLVQIQRVLCIQSMHLKGLKLMNHHVLLLYADNYFKLIQEKKRLIKPTELNIGQLIFKFRGWSLSEIIAEEVRGPSGALEMHSSELSDIMEMDIPSKLSAFFGESIEEAIIRGRRNYGRIPQAELELDYKQNNKLDYLRHLKLYEDIFRMLVTGGNTNNLEEPFVRREISEFKAKLIRMEENIKPVNCSQSENTQNLNLDLKQKLERRTKFKQHACGQMLKLTEKLKETLNKLFEGEAIPTTTSRFRVSTEEKSSISYSVQGISSMNISIEKGQKNFESRFSRNYKTQENSYDSKDRIETLIQDFAEMNKGLKRSTDHLKRNKFYLSSHQTNRRRNLRISSSNNFSRSSSINQSKCEFIGKFDKLIGKIDKITGKNDKVGRVLDFASSSLRKIDENLKVKEMIFREHAPDGHSLE